MPINGKEIKKVLLDVVKELSAKGPGHFQARSIINEASLRLKIDRDLEAEQAFLTIWYDLFRNGILSWGYDLSNCESPWCHISEKGRKFLSNLSRDPSNPDGYISYINAINLLNPITESYLLEALNTYNENCFKASSVMLGAASENEIKELSEVIINKLKIKGEKVSKDLFDWRIKRVIDELSNLFQIHSKLLNSKLNERIELYWSSLTGLIRIIRNDAGHPNSISQISEDSAYASLLIFPELYKLIIDLKDWYKNNY
jgi:hypothetical protein